MWSGADTSKKGTGAVPVPFLLRAFALLSDLSVSYRNQASAFSVTLVGALPPVDSSATMRMP